jgi:hypothetical protein
MFKLGKLKRLVISALIYSSALIFLSCTATQTAKMEPLTGESIAEFPKMIVGDSCTMDTWKGVKNYKVIKVNSDGSFVIEVQTEDGEKTWNSYYDNHYRLIKEIYMNTGERISIPYPPKKRLEFPLFVGKKWESKYHGKAIDKKFYDYHNSYTVEKIEMVQTKAGTFKAFKIQSIHRNLARKDFKKYFESHWYAPELKLVVKSEPSWREGNELISYNLANVDKETADVETKSVITKQAQIAEKSADEKITTAAKESTRKDFNIAGTRWAVIIGISQYKDTRIPFLRYAASDARSFYDWLISPNGGKYAPARVKLLINTDATAENMKQALFEWLGQAIEEDVVTFYFAGHGSPQSPDMPDNLFLLPYDVQYQSVATTGFPMWDIETALKRFIKAKRVIVITDACHAGGVGQSFDVARRGGRGINIIPISSNLQNLSKIGDGICIISASDDSQFSQESKKWGGGHGVFTYYLLQGLKGEADYSKDNRVSLGEIIPYLSEQVRRATRNAQTPTVAGKFDPALSIGK